jgi:hypothetical protein
MADILRLVPPTIGDGVRLNVDDMLEEAKGKDFTQAVIIAERQDGTTVCFGSANAGESLILIERAKRIIVFGEA